MNKLATIKHKTATLQISAEASQLNAIKHILKSALDAYSQSRPISANVVHAETKIRNAADYKTPGYYLRVYRLRADHTQQALADKLGIRQHHLSEIENNKRPLGKELAKKIAVTLKCDYKQFF
jgi:DNA-binding XRE family transcriptional regulator